MLYPLPVHPELDSLDHVHLDAIEAKCREACHLNTTEHLIECISSDMEDLAMMGVSRIDLYTTHNNMRAVFDRVDEFDQFACGNEHVEHCMNLIENLPAGFGDDWCRRSTDTNEIVLNGQHLRITRFVWGGAETCPIEKYFDNSYHGYERGDRDWFITNLVNKEQIWVPDLTISQIGMFGFAHGKSDPYRVDPVQYCKVFGVTGKVEPIGYHKVPYWGRGAGPHASQWIEDNYNIIENVDHQDYHAMVAVRKVDSNNDETGQSLFIHVKNSDYIINHTETKIEISGLQLDVENIFNFSNYTAFSKIDQIVLDIRDDSDAISTKLKTAPPRCVIQ